MKFYRLIREDNKENLSKIWVKDLNRRVIKEDI